MGVALCAAAASDTVNSRPTASHDEIRRRTSNWAPPNRSWKQRVEVLFGAAGADFLPVRGRAAALTLEGEVQRVLHDATNLFPFLNVVDRAEWDAAGVLTARLPKGTVAFAEGEPCRHVAFVLRGAIRVYKTGPDGRQLTLYYVMPGESCVLMWASVLAQARYNARAEAAEESEVLLVPVGVFLEWMKRYEPVRRFVYEALAQRLAAVMVLVEEIVFHHVDQRLAALLLERTSAREPELLTTHEQLALELGTAREVVSRTLKVFEEEGAVRLSRGRVSVMDRQVLERRRNGEQAG